MSRLSSLALRITPIVAILVLAPAPVAAAENAKSLSVFDLVIGDGGMGTWIELVLIILSCVGFTVAILRMMTIKADMLIPDGLADDLHNIFEQGVNDDGYNEALDIVAEDPSMLGAILSASLDKLDFGYAAMVQASETVGSAELNKYMAKINWLSLIAAIAPMLGLLGTVGGMIAAFLEMASSGGAVNPGDLAYAIGGAMITTATGLIIAIPMLFFFFFLRARINACFLEASIATEEILDYFRN